MIGDGEVGGGLQTWTTMVIALMSEFALLLILLPLAGFVVGYLTERTVVRHVPGGDGSGGTIRMVWDVTVHTLAAGACVGLLFAIGDVIPLPFGGGKEGLSSVMVEEICDWFVRHHVPYLVSFGICSTNDALGHYKNATLSNDTLLDGAGGIALLTSTFDSLLCFMGYLLRMVSICVGAAYGSAYQPVGLTGGIACGKSTVMDMLLREGNTEGDGGRYYAPVDLDLIAREVVDPTRIDSGDPSAYPGIVEAFGEGILVDPPPPPQDADGGNRRAVADPVDPTPPPRPIDRTKLGDVVFRDPVKRRLLNRLTHPPIIRIMLKRIASEHIRRLKPRLLRGGGSSRSEVTLVDIPLLFESGRPMRYLFGTVIVVATSPDVQLRRLKERNPELTEEQCRDRIKSQYDIERKVRGADIVIWNDGTVEDLEREVEGAHASVASRHGGWSRRRVGGLAGWIALCSFTASVWTVVVDRLSIS